MFLDDLRVKVDTAFTVIVACSVLWNISLERREEDVPGRSEGEGGHCIHSDSGMLSPVEHFPEKEGRRCSWTI